MLDVKYIIILGPPGSGKGTQAKMLSRKHNLFYLGTGDLMRDQAKRNTEIGKKIQEVWDRGLGELISDDLVDLMVNNKINEIGNTKSIVFDGYPRTIKQAENLKNTLGQDANIMVVNIEVEKENLIERMNTRRVCSNCSKIFFRPEEKGITKCDNCGGDLVQRQEDKPAVISKRIDVYNAQTLPLLDYYKGKSEYITIDGNPAIEEVALEIEKILAGKI